jgi:hypothetical protein
MNDVTEATFIEMEMLFGDNGLPSPYGWHGIEYLHWMEDVAELIERATAAANAGHAAERKFIERQIDALVVKARQRWNATGQHIPSRIALTDDELPYRG